jgi:hypothetical protein
MGVAGVGRVARLPHATVAKWRQTGRENEYVK